MTFNDFIEMIFFSSQKLSLDTNVKMNKFIITLNFYFIFIKYIEYHECWIDNQNNIILNI
jgi:hypothetical protein